MYVQGARSVYIKSPFVFAQRESKIIALTPCLHGKRVKSFIRRFPMPAACCRYAHIFGPRGRFVFRDAAAGERLGSEPGRGRASRKVFVTVMRARAARFRPKVKNSERSKDVLALPTIPVRATPKRSRKIALGKVGLSKVVGVSELWGRALPVEICHSPPIPASCGRSKTCSSCFTFRIFKTG